MTQLPPMPETAAYILRNSNHFGFRELSEDDFASRASAAIMTRSGADGKFLTRAPLDFFLSKTQDTMRPGAVIRDWGIKNTAVGKSRPVIVLEEDYPGIPIDQVAVLFEYQARLLHKLEADANRAGPSLSVVNEYPPTLLTLVNDDEDEDLMEKIEKQGDMHSTYRDKAVKWLRRRTPSNTRTVGFDHSKGRMDGRMRSSSITGLLLNSETIITIEIEARKTIKRPEIAVALDLQSDIDRMEFQTLLCSATSRRMLLYVALAIPEQRNGAIEMISPLLKNLRGSDGSMTTEILEVKSRRTLYPLSLYILPPPPKTSSGAKGMFSHNIVGMGRAIIPIGNDEFDFHYEAHPLVAAYNISKYITSVTSFLRTAQALDSKREPQEPDIREVNDPETLRKYEGFRAKSLRIVNTLPEDDTDMTFTIPFGRDVVVRARRENAQMVGFTDKSIRTGLIQLRQIESLMSEGEDIFLHCRLSALPNNDPDLPRQLLNFESDDWDGAFLHIISELSPEYKHPPQHLMEANVAPVKTAKGSILPIYEDEMANGNPVRPSAETIGYVMDGKTYYYNHTFRIRATVLAMDTSGKRFANGELGTVLLGVMSEERRRRPEGTITGITASRAPLQTVFESIGRASSMRGFTVDDRRALYKHLIQYTTHTEGDLAFIDPVKADLILEIEFSKMFLRQAPRFVRRTELTRQTDRFATDANKEASLKPMRYKDPVTGKMRTERMMPVLPVSQQALTQKKVRDGFVETGFAMLVPIEEQTNPQIEDATIVGIRSAIPDLDYKVDPETVLTAKTVYETNDGLVYFSDIGLDQFKENGPEPHIEGEVPSGVEALLTASLNPPAGGEFSRHRQIEPWRFKQERGKSRLRTYDLDDPREKAQAENFIGWNSRYNDYDGARAIVAPLRDDVKNWAIQSILIPKKYGLRRTANEIRLDSLEAPKWYQKAHPGWKKPTVDDIIKTSEPKFRAFVEASDSPKQMAIAANPPVFESPEAMDMGIATDKGNTKWHNQFPEGFEEQAETIPAIAKNWKKKSFRVEMSLGDFLEKYKDDERPYTVSHKIDGDSSMVMFDGEESIIWNHRGRWRRDFHITDEITASLKKAKVTKAMINGELYAVDSDGLTLPLNEVGSIIVSPKTIERQNQIRFTAFDITHLEAQGTKEIHTIIDTETPYQTRMKLLKEGPLGAVSVLPKSVKSPLLQGKTTSVVQSWRGEGDMSAVQKAWDAGMKEPNFEGLVLRFDNEPKSIKIKMKGTADLAVIGFYRGRAGGRDEEIIGGGGLAWMLPNGDFVYSGNAVIGGSIVEKRALLDKLLPTALEGLPKVRWGNHSVDPTKTHMTTGKGTMTPVKPTMVGEFQYRGLNWSEKPIYRLKGKKLVQVGTMRAPTMFQPSFKRWRTDKEITPQDLRMEQVPTEGTGKWGQVKA